MSSVLTGRSVGGGERVGGGLGGFRGSLALSFNKETEFLMIGYKERLSQMCEA